MAAFLGGVSWRRFLAAFLGGVSWRRFLAAFLGGVSMGGVSNTDVRDTWERGGGFSLSANGNGTDEHQ
jgi:hypothetical protein